jgi:hypothetical protein
MTIKQPERELDDGPIGVRRETVNNRERVMITVNDQTIEMSGFNAWRIFGCLAIMLEIPLPAKTRKAITLGDRPVDMGIESQVGPFSVRTETTVQGKGIPVFMCKVKP